MPGGPRERLEEPLPQRGQRRRAVGLGEHAEPIAAAGRQSLDLRLEELVEGVPVLHHVALGRPLVQVAAAVGIVHFQDRGLGEEVRGPQALRMLGVAFHLDRPAIDRADQQSNRMAVRDNRGGETLGHPGHAIGGPVGERADLPLLPTAAGQPGQGQRGPHQLHPTSPAQPAGIGFRRKLRFQKGTEPRGVGQLGQTPPMRLWCRRPACNLQGRRRPCNLQGRRDACTTRLRQLMVARLLSPGGHAGRHGCGIV